MAKAVGEAVERYSAAIYDRTLFPLFSSDTAPFPTVNPADFALYSPQQYESAGFPWVPFRQNTSIRWTPAINLSDETLAYIPAAFCWIPYSFVQGSGDSPIGQPISTGLACHGSWEAAVLSGLSEMVERDAFTIMWQARLSMPQIRIETLSDCNYELVNRFERTGDKVTLINITNDIGIPAILAVLVSERKERPAHVFAASVDPDPEVATRKALEELAHTRRYSQQVFDYLPKPLPDNDFESVLTQAEHLRFAADHDYRDAFEFVFASKLRQDFNEIERIEAHDNMAMVDKLVGMLSDAGLSAYAANLTSPDIAELGLWVVRVVVPGCHPLFMGHRIRALGGGRLYSVPQKCGYQALEFGAPDNPYPHPYP